MSRGPGRSGVVSARQCEVIVFRALIASHDASGGARPDSASPPEPAISLSWVELAYCGVVIVACYALRGSTGFGAAAAVPLLALVVPVKILVPVWTLLGIASSVTIVARDYRAVAGTALLRTLPAGLIGIVIGLYVFTQLDSRTLARGLGVLVVAYGAYSLWGTMRPPAVAAAAARPAALRAPPRADGRCSRRRRRHHLRHHGEPVLCHLFRRDPPRQKSLPRHDVGHDPDTQRGARPRLSGGRGIRSRHGRRLRPGLPHHADRDFRRRPFPCRHERRGVPPLGGRRADREW